MTTKVDPKNTLIGCGAVVGLISFCCLLMYLFSAGMDKTQFAAVKTSTLPPPVIVPTQIPTIQVVSKCPNGCTTQIPGCDIKGNISAEGKLYHVPGGRYYNQTAIDPKAGERWFCTETEATNNGWRRAANQ